MAEIKQDLQTCTRCHSSRELSCFNGGKQCIECLETRRRYYSNNTEKMIEATKQWQSENRNRNLETKKTYRDNNHDYIHEKLTCCCGSTYARQGKSSHIKTLKHIGYLAAQPSAQ